LLLVLCSIIAIYFPLCHHSSYFFSFFFLIILRPPTSTLFPYTTLFRSISRRKGRLTARPPPRRAAADPPTPGRRPQPVCEPAGRSEEHTSELQSQSNLVCRLLLEKKKTSAMLRTLQTPDNQTT